MRGNHNQKGQKPSSARKQLAKDQIPRLLPTLQDQLCIGFTLRFIATANFAGAISVNTTNLLDAMFIAVSATNGFQLFDFVKVKKVTIRSMGGQRALAPGVAGTPPQATVGVEFFGLATGSVGGGKQKSNSSIGYDEPAFVTLKPDPMSQVAQYQPSNGNSLFTVRAVDQDANPLAGTIVDIDVVYRNSGDVNPAAIATARAAMVTGAIYFNGMDGLPIATTQFRSAFIPRL
jgi:hypothetical protein